MDYNKVKSKNNFLMWMYKLEVNSNWLGQVFRS